MREPHRTFLKILEFAVKKMIVDKDQENLAGDFAEFHDRIVQKKGPVVGLLWYVLQIIKIFPIYMRDQIQGSVSMFSHYIKIALRNIKRNKAYSFINIAGLAVGIACCLMIFLFVQDELSFDRYHEKAERIFRLVDSFDVEGEMGRHFAFSSAPFAPTLKNEFPQVEETVRLFLGRRRMVSKGNKKFYEDGIFFADASLFDIFSFPLIKGVPSEALRAPNSLVISERIALKYFGAEDPLHKALQINEQEFLITGIMCEIPRNSHFQADMFASLKTLEQIPSIQERYFKSWARHEFYTYILLQKGYPASDLENLLPGFIEKHAAPQIKSILGGTLSSRLQPLKSIHLKSHLQYEISPTSDIKYIYIFSVIAVFILVIACVNFMNLSSARSANRSQEVGVRKVVGASRAQLIWQFLGESLWFTFFALLVALAILVICLPFFNQLTGKGILVSGLGNILIIGMLILVLFGVSIVSGSYPAIYISRFLPVDVLRKSRNATTGRSHLRKILVVVQFSISILLIISTALIIDQLDFLRNRKLGFDKEHVVQIPIQESSIRRNAESIKTDLLSNPNIRSACITHGMPGDVVAGDAIQLVTEEGNKTLAVRMIYTDHDYIQTMGMEIVQGRDFSKEMSTDVNEAFIVNQMAVHKLQLQDPLNTWFEWGDKKGRIIGVVRDFQFQSLKEEINPLIIQIFPSQAYTFALRIQPEGIPETLDYIEKKWQELDPAHPFEYSFLNETFDRIYRTEEKMGQIFGLFSALAIFIASLGLFGLSLFMVEQRAKEIGIRKVLGASLVKIFIFLSKEFAILVLLANILAWPAAYFLMQSWLQNFAYRIRITPWIFLLSSLAALLIAMITISFQTLKAVMADPVESLRYE